jgi:hypothetical protein
MSVDRVSMKHVLVLASILAIPSLALAEKQHSYESATVVSQDLNSYNAGAVAMPIGTSVAAVPVVRRSNIVVVETEGYRYTWSEVGKNTIILPVRGTISFYRDGNYFIVADSKNKKHKFALIGMTAK